MPTWVAPPDIHPVPCGESVCLTVADTVALSTWIFHTKETLASLAACPYVVGVPQ